MAARDLVIFSLVGTTYRPLLHIRELIAGDEKIANDRSLPNLLLP
jgi:hypothetical protein